MFKYNIFSFGGTNPHQDALFYCLKNKLDYSSLSKGQYEITSDLSSIQLGKEPTVALYWADENTSNKNISEIQKLEEASIPIIPIISDLTRAKVQLPSSLSEINAAELSQKETNNQIESITNSVLKFLGLLYKGQNIFISYRRSESENAAKQLFTELINRGFDVFLDKVDIPLGVNFQDTLKHKLSDSSMLLLLETPTFFTSQWTQEEYETAQNLRIGILEIKWPSVNTPRQYEFNDEFLLSAESINSRGFLVLNTVKEIADRVNSLCARYYESKRQGIVGNFIKDITKCHRTAIQNIEGTISIEGKNLLIFPLVGVPQSWDYYKVDNNDYKNRHIFLLYDNQCILDDWMKHLKWLEALSNINPIYINDDTSWIQQNL